MSQNEFEVTESMIEDLRESSEEIQREREKRIEQEINKTRLMIYRIDYSIFLQILQFLASPEKRFIWLPDNVEFHDDYEIVSVHENYLYRTFDVTVRSETFEPVINGTMIPAINVLNGFSVNRPYRAVPCQLSFPDGDNNES